MRTTTMVLALLAGCARPAGVPLCPTPVAEGPVAALAVAPVAVPAAAAAPTGPVLDGIPAAPGALAARIAPYLEARRADVADFDGQRLLVLTRMGASAQVHQVTGPGADRTQLSFEAEPVRGARLLQGGAVIFTVDVGGDENFQFFRLKDGVRTRLTDGKSRNEFLVVSPGGARVAWSSNARNGVDFDLWTADPARPETARLAVQGTGSWAAVDLSPDGRRALAIETLSILDARLYLVDLAAGTHELVGDHAAYRTARFAADGKRAFVTSDRDGEFVALHELDLAKKSFRRLAPELRWDVEELELSPGGDRLAFLSNQAGRSALHFLDTRLGTVTAARGAPDGVLRGLHFDRAGKRLAVTVDAGDQPGDAYVYDLAAARATRWTTSEVGGLDPRRFVRAELIDFATFDGARIPAWLYRPKQNGKLAVVIDIHGGPEAQARPALSPLVQFLASELGVAVIQPNVRGSDGYGKSYLALDDGKRRLDSVKDIGALLDWIGTRADLDPGRVAVMGGSYGGYMVLAALVAYGDRLRAGIDVVGISSFVTFLENTSAYRRDRRRVEYGDERDPEMRAFLDEISPLGHAGEIKSALFVAQGLNDPRVPASEAAQIVAAVRAAGRPAWYLLFPDEGHGFHKKPNRDLYQTLAAAFLAEHLGVAL